MDMYDGFYIVMLVAYVLVIIVVPLFVLCVALTIA